MKTPQRKPNKVLTDEELEQKILNKYNKENPQPTTLKERVNNELDKLTNKLIKTK